MDCSKCRGLMVFESFQDPSETGSRNLFGGWRCLACGRISDPMIEAHKKNGPSMIGSKVRRKSFK
jgi:hypothetical protein